MPEHTLNHAAARISTTFSIIHGNVSRGEYLQALRHIGNVLEPVRDLTTDLVQEAYNDGATKKEIAALLGVHPATFRGMEKTR